MTKSKSTNSTIGSPLLEEQRGGSYIQIHTEGNVARINLNRPERHNAIVPELINELNVALDKISVSDELLFVVLSGNGRSFCAGADLNWFSGADERTQEQNAAQYKQLADVLLKLFQLPQITIAAVRGNVFGGGIGLMAACDFVLAETNTKFMFSEVKLGLLPATILPFVAKRLSLQYLRKWILTGKMFAANDARQAGLVDILSADNMMESTLAELLISFEFTSPSAIKRAKQLINQVASGTIDVTDSDITSAILAEALLSPEGQEGIHSFLEKRKPVWKTASTTPFEAPLQPLPKGERPRR